MADGILTPCNVARSWHWFHQVTASYNVACGSGIVTVNSPSGSTLQCDTWLWYDMPLNSPKRPPYWNSTSGFDFEQITAVDMSSAPVSEVLSKSDYPQQKKITSCRFSRWRISAILDFRDPVMGSLRSPCTTFYSSSIESIALNRVFAFWRQTDRQTNRWTNRWTSSMREAAVSLSRAAA